MGVLLKGRMWITPQIKGIIKTKFNEEYQNSFGVSVTGLRDLNTVRILLSPCLFSLHVDLLLLLQIGPLHM